MIVCKENINVRAGKFYRAPNLMSETGHPNILGDVPLEFLLLQALSTRI